MKSQVDPSLQLASTCDYLPVRLAKALNIVTFVHRSVLDSFHAAIKVVNDSDIDVVGSVLHLTQDAIRKFVARLVRGSHNFYVFLSIYSQDFPSYFLCIILKMPQPSFSN